MFEFRKTLKETLLAGGLILLLAAGLPLLVVVAFLGRAVLMVAALAALAGSVVLLLVSPRFRGWMEGLTAMQTDYKGLHLNADVALHPGHSWARVWPDEVIVGADDLVQSLLGPVERIEFPSLQGRVQRGDPLIVLRRGDRKVALPAPVSGTVVGCNQDLIDRPWLVNRHPFSEGWLVRLRGDRPWRERRRLLRGIKAQAWFRREVDRMISTLMSGSGEATPRVALADGGSLVEGLHRQIDDETWKRLETAFFQPQSDLDRA